MPITGRPATWNDIEPCLSIQPKNYGDALVGKEAALGAWRRIAGDPFFASAVLEANPAIGGQRLIGFGASVFVSEAFADAEIAHPRPDINSRIISSLCVGRPALATREEIALANAGDGVSVVVLAGNWRDGIVTADERHDLQTIYVFGFAEWLAGYRIRRIIYETVDEAAAEFVDASVEYRAIANFPAVGRRLHIMTRQSATAMPASVGNLIFKFTEPLLRLRDSDQQLLVWALRGATDLEVAGELGITLAAVKARWRSTFARIGKEMPELVRDEGEEEEGRGKQKRHRVLAYVRSHPEELRPFDWSRRTGATARTPSLAEESTAHLPG